MDFNLVLKHRQTIEFLFVKIIVDDHATSSTSMYGVTSTECRPSDWLHDGNPEMNNRNKLKAKRYEGFFNNTTLLKAKRGVKIQQLCSS
jgi:hypothetical protein